MSNLTREDIQKLRDVYVSTPNMGAEGLAAISSSIVGRKIPVELIKHYLTKDGWGVERNSLQSSQEDEADSDDIRQEMDIVRRILFHQIVTASTRGLFISGDFDKEEIISRLSNIDGIEISSVSPRGVDHNLVNAYMNLLTKGNFEIKQQGTGKTSMQQVLEIVEGQVEQRDKPNA